MSDTIDGLGISAEKYAQLSDDEQEAMINEYVATLEAEGKSAEEIENELAEVKASLEDIQELYEGYVDDLKDDDDDNSALIAQCEALIEELEEGEDLLDDANSNYLKHNKSYESNESAYISDLVYDGQTYTYDMTGGDVFWSAGDVQLVAYDSATGTIKYKVTNPDNPEEYCYVEIKTKSADNPFNSDQTETEYLEEENIINTRGEVITDVNGDGFMNEKDIEAALEQRYGNTLEDGQTQIYFSSGISAEDIDTMKNTWPTDLLKKCYWGEGNTTSFYDELFVTEETTNLAVIEGYSSASEALSSKSISQYCDNELGDLADEAQAALDALFGYYADPSAADISEIWSDIYASWSTLTDEEKATLIQYLALAVATSSPEKFAELFGPQASTLESMLDYQNSSHPNYTANDKLIVLLLESIGGVGKYGGTPYVWSKVFSPDGSEEGQWKDHEENDTAIENYINIMSQEGQSIPAEAYTAQENNAKVGDLKDDDETATASSYDDSKDEFVAKYDTLIDKPSKGTTENEWEEVVNSVSANLFDSDGNIVSNAAQVLIDACGKSGSLEAEDFDDALSNLIYYLSQTMSEEFLEELFTYEVCQALLNALIDDGGSEAHYQDEAEAFLRSMM